MVEKGRTRIRKKTREKIKVFDVFVFLFMVLVAITTIYPFWYALVVSLSGVDAVSYTHLDVYKRQRIL